LLCGLFVTSVISASPSFSATCAQGGPCALGDTGPGGGTVFYYKASGFNCGPSFTDTCHYLEVAPSGWQNSILSGYGSDGMFSWSNGTPRLMVPAAITGISTTVNIASSTLGLGYKYTQAEVTQDSAYYSFPASPYAPNTSRAYAGGTKSDWYLPMPSELNQLCKYVRGQLWVSDDTLCNSTGTLTLGFQNGPYYSAYLRRLALTQISTRFGVKHSTLAILRKSEKTMLLMFDQSVLSHFLLFLRQLCSLQVRLHLLSANLSL